MFSGLRLRLTLLYLLAALALIALIGGGTYLLLDYYFQNTTDLALRYRAAQEFQRLGAPLPDELSGADVAWYASRGAVLPGLRTGPGGGGAGPARDNDDEPHERRPDEHASEADYDGELAAIFVLPLSSAGELRAAPNSSEPPFAPDREAAGRALERGSDWRTALLADGTRVRLATYRLSSGDPAVVQLGRTLADQDRVLKRLLKGLLALGGGSAVLMSAGSWWLAGRSLRPAQLAWERQQGFVANASHELRTPLTLLRASAEVAQRSLPPADTDRRELLDDVLEECDHMSRLVDDLLLLSRLDAGRLTMERERIALPDLLDDVRRQVGRLADERGVRVTVDGASGAALADPTRVRQVVLILLDNALRHTSVGGAVHLTARPHGRYVQLAVADTGSGIPPEHLPYVFERFYRADSARGGSASSGLGLSIARALVEAQQGQISIESQPGQGTRVVVGLPSADAHAFSSKGVGVKG